MNTLNSGTKDSIQVGQSLLTTVRAINKVAGNPAAGKILQIEVAEKNSTTSLLGEFNPNDTRIGKSKAQLAWINIEPSVLFEAFNIQDTALQQRINNLTVSTRLPVTQRVEGTHFINLNILNPTFKGEVLRVQIVETTVRPNEQTNPKINPSTNQVIKHNGQPVYRTASVVKASAYKPVYLTSDVVEQPVVPARPAMQPNPATMASVTE